MKSDLKKRIVVLEQRERMDQSRASAPRITLCFPVVPEGKTVYEHWRTAKRMTVNKFQLGTNGLTFIERKTERWPPKDDGGKQS